MMRGQFPFSTNKPFDVSETPTKLQHLCRMCAATCKEPVSLYGPEGVAHELAVKFSSYLPIKVAETDTLPLQLCYDCTNLLIQWDAAVLVAIAADKKLRALQWREQFERQRAGENMKGSNTEESLSCSLCPKSGMVFRGLIEHLKTHERPPSISNDNNNADCNKIPRESQLPETIVPNLAGDTSLDADEHNDSSESFVFKRILRPKQKKSRTSGQSSSETNTSKVRLRSKRKSSGKQDEIFSESSEDGSDDGVVTSSTSGGFNLLSAPSSSVRTFSNSDQNLKVKNVPKDSDPTPFKPKVRIISAESINQSLEERAKANQTAKSPESQNSSIVKTAQPPMQSVLKPLTLASASQKTIVLPGGVFKVDSNKTPTKILKLPDGRFVRLLETKVPIAGGKFVYAPPRNLPSSVLSRIAQPQDKEKTPLAQPSPPVNQEIAPVNIAPAPEINSSSNESSKDLRKTVMLSDSKIITFNHQPGPKNSGSRYICVFCGKRNLTQDCLEQHARSHSKDQVVNVSVPSEQND